MKKLISLVGLLSLWALPSHAQTLQFDAQVGPDGKVQLVPRDETDAPSPPATTEDKSQSENIIREAEPSSSPYPYVSLYLVTDPAGAVKGVFTSQPEALSHPLSPGDTLQVLPVSAEASDIQVGSTVPAGSWGDEYLQAVAKQAGQRLMQAARDNACSYDVLPVSITPTVEVSFTLLAGGSLSISATWETKDLCGDIAE